MKAECTQRELRFEGPRRHEIAMRFDGGQITSDGGFPMLAAVDRRVRAVERFAACFQDHRDPDRVDHPLLELVRQRIFALAAGYEDLNDHEHLRNDVLLRAVVGSEATLAGKSTLNRLELGTPEAASGDRYHRIVLDQAKVDELYVELFVESPVAEPEEIIIDLDATDDPIHGNQEGRFFHGYYDGYCYPPGEPMPRSMKAIASVGLMVGARGQGARKGLVVIASSGDMPRSRRRRRVTRVTLHRPSLAHSLTPLV